MRQHITADLFGDRFLTPEAVEQHTEGKDGVFLFSCALISAVDRWRVLFVLVLEKSVPGLF